MVHKIVQQLWSFINTVSEKLVQSKSMAFTNTISQVNRTQK